MENSRGVRVDLYLHLFQLGIRSSDDTGEETAELCIKFLPAYLSIITSDVVIQAKRVAEEHEETKLSTRLHNWSRQSTNSVPRLIFDVSCNKIVDPYPRRMDLIGSHSF